MTKRLLFLISVLMSSMVTMWAGEVTVNPTLDVNFRTASGNTAWQTVKNAADEGNNDFELTYTAGFFALQKYTVADLQNATKLVITLTVGSKSGVDAVKMWSIANNTWTAETGVDDIVPLVTTAVGVAPRATEGTVNTPPIAGAKVSGSNPAQATFTITGTALATIKANAAADGTFTLLLTNNDLLNSNNKRSYLSNNSANAEASRPTLVATVETPSVVNKTTGVSYSTLAEAFAAAVTAGTDAELEVSDDQKLTDRLTWNKAAVLTITPTKDITIKGPKNKMWFLVNVNNATLKIGSADHKITFDGINDDRTTSSNVDVTRRENSSNIYLTNIEYKDFNCGANHLISCKNAGGAIYLEDITFTNCSTTDALISNLREANDALYMKGHLNQSGCTGTTIFVAKNRIRLGDPEGSSIYDGFSANSDITIKWGGELAEGTNVIVKVPASAAFRFKLVGSEGWWLARKASNGDMYLTQKDDAPVDGISVLMDDEKAADANYYDLQGRKVAQPGKGVYIHNGKKVILK